LPQIHGAVLIVLPFSTLQLETNILWFEVAEHGVALIVLQYWFAVQMVVPQLQAVVFIIDPVRFKHVITKGL